MTHNPSVVLELLAHFFQNPQVPLNSKPCSEGTHKHSIFKKLPEAHSTSKKTPIPHTRLFGTRTLRATEQGRLHCPVLLHGKLNELHVVQQAFISFSKHHSVPVVAYPRDPSIRERPHEAAKTVNITHIGLFVFI